MQYTTPGGHVFIATTNNPVICRECGGHEGNHDAIPPLVDPVSSFQETHAVIHAGVELRIIGMFSKREDAERLVRNLLWQESHPSPADQLFSQLLGPVAGGQRSIFSIVNFGKSDLYK